MIKIKPGKDSKTELFKLLKGMAAGTFWVFGLFVFNIQIYYLENIVAIIIYCILISVIQFFILRNNTKSRAAVSWGVSMPFSVVVMTITLQILFHIFKNITPAGTYIGDAVREYYRDTLFLATFLYYRIYYITTFISSILAIIFSTPKKRTVKDK